MKQRFALRIFGLVWLEVVNVRLRQKFRDPVLFIDQYKINGMLIE